jgi:protein tyrosine phosphatase (PTP) superfamily phosphohydrolase (DUF442 family)
MPIPKFQARSNNRRSVFLALGTALLLAACVAGNLYLSRTYHLATVQDGVLYRDGNRGLREFSTAVRRVRPKVVVSLIDDGELGDPNKPQFSQEADFLSTHGIRQVRIPVKLGGWPSSDDIRKFLAIAADPKNRPILVHCAQGVRRTGMFVAAYQESAMKFDPALAKSAILSFGHSDHVTDDVKAFIDAYDPVTMTVATTMPAASSSE